MKRVMLQLLRSLVTIIVVSTMAAMIFSLRSELAAAKAQLQARPTAVVSSEVGALAAIHARTSIRKFNPEREVSEAELETILKAAVCAPSAMDRRPWELVVVRDRAQLAALGAALPYSRLENGATLAVVVCGKLDNGLEGRNKEYWIQDCSALSQNLLLAVQALGLGAVWTGVYPGEDRVAAVREILSIPEEYMPLNVIPIGQPAESPAPKDKWDAGRVHRDRW